MKKVYLYKKFERFWHWSQAALILFLAVTGFEIHGSFNLFGFEKAVYFHRLSALLLIALFVFAIFWHLSTGEWRQYIPTISKLREQMMYYAVGIFKGADHPTEKTVSKKLNPLQAITYLAFKLLIAPVMVVTGLLFFFYKVFDPNNIVIVKDIPLDWVAWVHTFGAYALIAFVIIHVYMTTTGHTLTSNINAMLTGWEELDEEEIQRKEEDITDKHENDEK